ncbi:hypothetical protein PV325_003579 [Microctonus aethiopoides]|nr:hypothetical protein PV325_003579 [Microctonus aethiopoides]
MVRAMKSDLDKGGDDNSSEIITRRSLQLTFASTRGEPISNIVKINQPIIKEEEDAAAVHENLAEQVNNVESPGRPAALAKLTSLPAPTSERRMLSPVPTPRISFRISSSGA